MAHTKTMKKKIFPNIKEKSGMIALAVLITLAILGFWFFIGKDYFNKKKCVESLAEYCHMTEYEYNAEEFKSLELLFPQKKESEF